MIDAVTLHLGPLVFLIARRRGDHSVLYCLFQVPLRRCRYGHQMSLSAGCGQPDCQHGHPLQFKVAAREVNFKKKTTFNRIDLWNMLFVQKQDLTKFRKMVIRQTCSSFLPITSLITVFTWFSNFMPNSRFVHSSYVVAFPPSLQSPSLSRFHSIVHFSQPGHCGQWFPLDSCLIYLFYHILLFFIISVVDGQ